jgi:glycerol-3-phosphate acyltransferase PlsY
MIELVLAAPTAASRFDRDVLSLVLGLVIGFACGSIPFGYLLVRLRTGADVRDTGSGNIGATNVSRALGTAGGVATLLLDAGKGAVGVVAAGLIGAAVAEAYGWRQLGGPAAAALGAVLGHCYTPWLNLRGGKGVATLLGAFGVLAPAATAVGAAVLVATAVVSRMMSLASLCGTGALAVATLWLGEVPYATPAATLAAVVIFWRHRANIARILRGEERKLGRGAT